jgi:hypothetical protein
VSLIFGLALMPDLHAIPLSEWTGINALLYYGPSLMKSMGLEGDTILLVGSGFVNIVQFLAVLPAIIYIDHLGM